ncbi:MAG TPA: EAL domain-containing protein [Gemmatimonadales bacterium]|nr:EAL domain-containing protein [Gemmatimonadales bacterium]
MPGLLEPRPPVILTVDDDATTRAFLRAYLEEAGLEVMEATGGEEALAVFVARAPDLVLLDVAMPGMDGFETCAALRKLHGGSTVPIVMLTGMDDVGAITRAYEAGATDFEVKSVHWIVLAQRIRYLLRAKRTMDELVQSESRLAAAQRIARVGSWQWDVGTGLHHWSAETRRLLGVPDPDMVPTQDLFLSRVHPDDRPDVEAALTHSASVGTGYSLEHRLLLPDDSELVVHGQAECLVGSDGKALRLAGTLQDITERRRAEERIRRLAYFDAQTELPNRVLFQERVEQAVADARRAGRLVALMFMDLDHFKRVNDTLGHSAGDQLLAEVAARLGRAVRDTDPLTRGTEDAPDAVLARHGGDEFIMCLSGITRAEDAARVAARVLASFEEPMHLHGGDVFMTASLGISLYPQDGDTAETLLKHADVAMYSAKSSGRNNYQFYDAKLSSRAFQRLALETGLRKALERSELVLHLQPVVDTAAHTPIGAEALIRWNHPEMGLVGPDDFIPLAEECGLVVPIGDWVITEAIRIQASLRTLGFPLAMAVNLSGQQVRRPGLAEHVRRALREVGTTPESFFLEMTESVLMHQGQDAEHTLRKLRELGVRIAIDDFGTGYSSLSYLRRFPVDMLKMDRSFVRGIEINPDNAAITAAVAAMARSLRVEPLAEGVERAEQRDVLRRQGFRLMQGYLFGKPLPEAEFVAALKTGFTPFQGATWTGAKTA